MIKIRGNIRSAIPWLRTLPKRSAKAVHGAILATLEEGAEMAKQEIMRGDIRPPSKVPPTLIDTGSYVREIGVYKSKDRGVYVGLPPTGKHPPSGLEWQMLWRILRYGTARMPPRPHIDTVAGEINTRLRARLRGMGFRVVGVGVRSAR